jgi:hypothetical protein
MFYSARLTLLKACLASIPIYLMSVIKFSKWALQAINLQMANFFWDDHCQGLLPWVRRVPGYGPKF